ncbi:hypothetical protein [Acerihabitans arboris]|uniref:Uncharacterized protein n=1 Tax=Acerihabitans arboris TaxID=2691583 RepID=A0A845SJ59_9GAMM|nr:hypothetical protein [Acerihabitans arboris]NDL62668.1 hypothetical protein [Acerihabitans arboris]
MSEYNQIQKAYEEYIQSRTDYWSSLQLALANFVPNFIAYLGTDSNIFMLPDGTEGSYIAIGDGINKDFIVKNVSELSKSKELSIPFTIRMALEDTTNKDNNSYYYFVCKFQKRNNKYFFFFTDQSIGEVNVDVVPDGQDEFRPVYKKVVDNLLNKLHTSTLI